MVQVRPTTYFKVSASYVNPRIRDIPESARQVKNDISDCENQKRIGAGRGVWCEGKVHP
jgi:hypothetical protein